MPGRSTSYTARGYATPRSGLLSGRSRSGRSRSLLARAFARNSPLRHMDWILIVVVAGLSAIGTLLVWSATQPGLIAAGEDPRTYLKKQLLNVIIGLALMVGVSLADTRQLRTWAPLFYGVTVLALLAVLTPIGSDINGAHAWISLPGGFQVEPSEFAKLGLILSTAWLLARQPPLAGGPLSRMRGSRPLAPGPPGNPRYDPSGRPRLRDAGLAALAAAPLIVLVEREPALGVMLVLVFTLAGMVVVSGIRLYWVLGLLAVATGGIYAIAKLHLLKGYQLTRLTSFLHPAQDLAGTGYNGLQAKIAVGSGGLHGQGLFHGTFTGGNFVPSVQTDFIFTVAGEELGFIGCAVIVALLAIIVFRAIRAAQIADDMFGMLVASGVAIWFLFQAFVNIGMTIGIMPITGLPLPFISYGGSAIFADMIAIGLVQSVRRHHKLFTY